ncbi:hypothetical protein EDB83DRAFT_733851 [Lactarius deliciosus]|nr:hypothetical protein EDB83DRAFT_733851 [Lactarius deliciosus]
MPEVYVSCSERNRPDSWSLRQLTRSRGNTPCSPPLTNITRARRIPQNRLTLFRRQRGHRGAFLHHGVSRGPHLHGHVDARRVPMSLARVVRGLFTGSHVIPTHLPRVLRGARARCTTVSRPEASPEKFGFTHAVLPVHLFYFLKSWVVPQVKRKSPKLEKVVVYIGNSRDKPTCRGSRLWGRQTDPSTEWLRLGQLDQNRFLLLTLSLEARCRGVPSRPCLGHVDTSSSMYFVLSPILRSPDLLAHVLIPFLSGATRKPPRTGSSDTQRLVRDGLSRYK